MKVRFIPKSLYVMADPCLRGKTCIEREMSSFPPIGLKFTVVSIPEDLPFLDLLSRLTSDEIAKNIDSDSICSYTPFVDDLKDNLKDMAADELIEHLRVHGETAFWDDYDWKVVDLGYDITNDICYALVSLQKDSD